MTSISLIYYFCPACKERHLLTANGRYTFNWCPTRGLNVRMRKSKNQRVPMFTREVEEAANEL